MDLSGLNKIINTLGEALGVFDFSFFISGFTTFSFLLVKIHYFIPDILHKLSGWEAIVVTVFVIYLCGLMSWAIGKMIRWFFLCFLHGSIHGVRADLKAVIMETNRGLGIRENITNPEVLYTKMWIELSKCDEGKERVAFINQMWVKRAMFEGLIVSWLVGFLVALDVECYQSLLHLEDNSCVPCILKIATFIMASVSWYMGTEYARDQIKEIVVAYHDICK